MRWPTVNLLDLCSPKQWPTISSKQLTENGFTVYGANGQIGFYHLYNHEDPTILITCRGATCGTINISPPKCYVTGNAMSLDNPRTELIDFQFFYYALQARGLKDTITGAAQPQITRANLSRVEIPLPTLSEQHRIVEVLDQADALRKKRAEADAKAARILPALFYKMFGDPAINPKGWPIGSLGDLTIDLRYGTSVKCQEEALGLPVLRIPNVIDGHINLDDLKYINLSSSDVRKLILIDGDILFVRTNGNRNYVGRCAVFENDSGDFLFASYLIRARLDKAKVEPKFITTLLSLPTGRQAMSPFIRTTAGQSNISQEGLRQIPIILPPLESQNRFRLIIGALESAEQQRIFAGRKIESLFHTLLHRAFTGVLTAKWREAHMKELLAEMEHQVKALEGN